jgi:hypothetical protein
MLCGSCTDACLSMGALEVGLINSSSAHANTSVYMVHSELPNVDMSHHDSIFKVVFPFVVGITAKSSRACMSYLTASTPFSFQTIA